jgi:stage II sporulation protein AA (anti-sigma F factor antagonist)
MKPSDNPSTPTVPSDTDVITPAPELDMANAPHLGSQILEALGRDKRTLILDFECVRMIDSAGIGVLLSSHRRVKAAGGELIVANASAHVRRVFELTGVGRSLRLA